jgi:hypothetical protein
VVRELRQLDKIMFGVFNRAQDTLVLLHKEC